MVVAVVVDFTLVFFGNDEPNAASCLTCVGQQSPTIVP